MVNSQKNTKYKKIIILLLLGLLSVGAGVGGVVGYNAITKKDPNKKMSAQYQKLAKQYLKDDKLNQALFTNNLALEQNRLLSDPHIVNDAIIKRAQQKQITLSADNVKNAISNVEKSLSQLELQKESGSIQESDYMQKQQQLHDILRNMQAYQEQSHHALNTANPAISEMLQQLLDQQNAKSMGKIEQLQAQLEQLLQEQKTEIQKNTPTFNNDLAKHIEQLQTQLNEERVTAQDALQKIYNLQTSLEQQKKTGAASTVALQKNIDTLQNQLAQENLSKKQLEESIQNNTEAIQTIPQTDSAQSARRASYQDSNMQDKNMKSLSQLDAPQLETDENFKTDTQNSINDKKSSTQNASALKLFLRGNQYYREKKYDDAIQVYQQAIDMDATFFKAYVNQGLSYQALDNIDIAIEKYVAAYKLDNNVKRMIYIIDLYTKQKNFTTALEYAEQLYEQHSDDALVNNVLGEIYFKLENYEKAITFFKQAYEIDKNPIYAYNLATIYAQTNNYTAGIEPAQYAVTAVPDNAQYNYRMAYLLRRINKTDVNIAPYLTQALQDNPDYIDASSEYSLYLLDTQKYTQAITVLQNALQYHESNEGLINNIINAYMGISDYANALLYAQKRESFDSQNLEALYTTAKIYIQMDNYKQAEQKLLFLIQQDKNYEKAYSGLIQIALAQEKFDVAMTYVNQLLDINPDNAEALLLKQKLQG